jgi:hypothetical protein
MAMRSAIALIGSASLLTCIASCSKLPAQKELSTVAETKAVTPSSATLPQPSSHQNSQVDQEKAVEDVPLKSPISKEFLEKLKRVKYPQDREQYTGAIWELNRLSKKDPKNKAILETLVQNQDKLLAIFQKCGYKNDDGSSSFHWDALNYSNFWKLSTKKHLVQLVCGAGAYNLTFVLFITSEMSGKTQFKPLILTEFYEDKNRKIQRRESAEASGRTCPESQFEREGFYNESTKELCIWGKYLGQGYCGTQGLYKLQDNRLILQRFTANFDCNSYKPGGSVFATYKTLYP